MCQLTGLWCFNVRRNNLTGSILDNIGDCKSFQILDLSYNQLTGEIPFDIEFPQLATLALQGNKLTGRIPEAIGLIQLLSILYLSDNHLTGTIPPILGNLNYTTMLMLSGNNLTGSIPPELGNMSNLKYLELDNNELTGQIPPELGKLKKLMNLNLARNQLEGPIPENISSCIALTFFNVQSNNLNGTITLEFQKLERLSYLDLSSNDINGMIPIALGLIRLDTLNLSGNNLSGFLPAEFGNLINTVDIDLSANRLSGPIPQELGELHNLVSLILNNNNLSGEVPLQLTNCVRLTTLFFGNPGLCGHWIGSHCGTYSRHSKASISTPVIVCISLGSVIIFCVIMIALYCSNQSKPFIEGSERKMGQGCPRLVILHMDMVGYMYEDIMRITENLNEKYIIGYGATSQVYKCVPRNHKPIAIKRMHRQSTENLRAFETELKIVGSIKHRNLVGLQGYSLSPHGNLLFYDYMVNGSLWDILHGTSNRLDWNTRLRIALGAAQGLAYLHPDCNPRIIHRDVKTSNILLDDNFEARLTDFGIAKCIPSAETHTSTCVVGTIGYIDPEYARTLRLNEKSDVYSYGIVLLELLTGRKAVDNYSNLLQLIRSKVDNRFMDTVDPEVAATCADLAVVRKVFELAFFCSRERSSDRPTMIDVVLLLQSLLPASTQAEVSEQTNQHPGATT